MALPKKASPKAASDEVDLDKLLGELNAEADAIDAVFKPATKQPVAKASAAKPTAAGPMMDDTTALKMLKEAMGYEKSEYGYVFYNIDKERVHMLVKMPNFPKSVLNKLSFADYGNSSPDNVLTVLHIAVRGRNGALGAILIEGGADPNVLNKHGVSVMHLALEGQATEEQKTEPFMQMVEAAKDRLDPQQREPIDKRTLVQRLLLREYWDCLFALFTHCSKIDMTVKDQYGLMPLQVAIGAGAPDELIELMEKYGKKPTADAVVGVAVSVVAQAASSSSDKDLVAVVLYLCESVADMNDDGHLRQLAYNLKKSHGM